MAAPLTPLDRDRMERLIREHTEVISSPMLCQSPVVSVVCQTFNHAPFLRQAIEGVLAQRTDFPFELIIGEDASSDNTLSIALEYQRKRPDMIIVLRSTENLGHHTGSGRLNYIRNLNHCRGRYIAVNEGDDFWTDPEKLRRQVEYLETHPETAGCFTDCDIVDEHGKLIEPRPFWKLGYKPRYSQRECLNQLKSSYGTATLMFRRGVYDEGLPDYFWKAGCDFLLDLMITGRGFLDHLPGTTSAYRIHGGGIWQGTSGTRHLFEMLHRLRSLSEEPSMNEVYGEDIREMRRQVYGRILNTRRSSGRSGKQRHVSGQFPVFTVTGSFDFGRDSHADLEAWLEAASRCDWGFLAVLLVFVEGNRAEIAWRRPTGEVALTERALDECRLEAGEWVLPDLSSDPPLAWLSGKRVTRGLALSQVDFQENPARCIGDMALEINQIRVRYERIMNSRYFRFGLFFWSLLNRRKPAEEVRGSRQG